MRTDPASASRTVPTLHRPAAFVLVAAMLLTLMAAAAAPSPLYPVYQRMWGLSALTLTAVFGIYAAALLVALLTVGSLSDHVGRRPVIAGALLLAAISMIIFGVAGQVTLLFAARVLQGLATGAALGTLSAALIDLQPGHRPRLAAVTNAAGPPLGLAAGATGSGLLVQYAPAPTTLGYSLLAAGFAVLAAATALLPETVMRRPGALAALRPRVAVPAAARRRFRAAVPSLIATWAVGGLYLSLGPTLAASTLHVANHLVAGAVVATLNLAGSLAAVAAFRLPPQRAVRWGAAALAAGIALTLPALALGSVPAFFVATAVAGAGFGTTFLGAFGSLAASAAAHERAGLLAAVFVVSYLAFSVPTVVAGALVPAYGLLTITTGYGAVVVALALVALVTAPAFPLRSDPSGPGRQRRRDPLPAREPL